MSDIPDSSVSLSSLSTGLDIKSDYGKSSPRFDNYGRAKTFKGEPERLQMNFQEGEAPLRVCSIFEIQAHE